MRRLFKRYVTYCRKRNVFWELTLEQFHKLTSSECVYCHRAPTQISRAYKYNGIDRKDPLKGYTVDNCAACCGPCNFLKGNRLSYDEMLVVAQALIKFRAQRATRI